MKVVFTAQKENFFSPTVLVHTNGTNVFLFHFIDCSSIESSDCIVLDSALLLKSIEHFFVKNGLKCLIIDAIYRRLIAVRISIHDSLEFIVPVNPVEVVLATWVYLDGCILSDYYFFRRVWSFILLLCRHLEISIALCLLPFHFCC